MGVYVELLKDSRFKKWVTEVHSAGKNLRYEFFAGRREQNAIHQSNSVWPSEVPV